MKVAGWIIAVLLLVVVGAGAYLVLNSGGLIKSGIESFGPDYLGTDVSVGSVDLDLAAGSARLSDLVIGNPSGFDGPYAMRLAQIGVTLDVEGTSADLIVIKQMSIDGASLAAVARGQKTNLQQIMDNLDRAAGSEPASAESAEESAIRFIVDRFAFTGADVSLTSDVVGNMALDIPDIHLADVGRKSNGATAAELAQQLLKPISAAVTRAAVSRGVDLEGLKSQATEMLREKIGSGLKDLTDRLNR